MQIKPLFRDPVTGYLREAQPGDTLNTATQAVFNEYVTLFQDATVLTCCALVNYTAIPINSASLPGPLLRTTPVVDCILLESGLEGQTVLAACTHGKSYASSASITYSTSDTLYLGHDGLLTTTPPTLLSGDNWQVIVGRLINHNQFIFDPQLPVDLNSGGGGYQGNIPSVIGHNNTFLFTDGNILEWKQISQADIAPNAAITSFVASQNTFEVGQQINTPTFTASYNQTVTLAQLKDSVNNLYAVVGTPTSFNSAYNFKLNTTGSVLFTLQATLGSVLTANTSMSWYWKRFYGTSTSINLTDLTLLQYNGLSSGRGGSYSVVANTLEYIYFAFPASFGTPSFNVGGFDGGFSQTNSISFTNSFGITTTYNIYRSDNHSLGSTVVIIS